MKRRDMKKQLTDIIYIVRRVCHNAIRRVYRWLQPLVNRLAAKPVTRTPQDEFRRYRRFHRELARNPYLQSKALWHDVYGSVQRRLENSYRLCFALTAIIVIILIGFIGLAAETKVKPVVAMIHGNEVITMDPTQDTHAHFSQSAVALVLAKQFIREVRSVSADRDVNRDHQLAAYAMVSNAAVGALHDFYQTHVPNVVARHQLISVAITSVLRESPHTLTIRWQEIIRHPRSGERLAVRHFIAELSYHYQSSAHDADVLKYNPLGFYVTQLAWSADQVS